MGASAAPRFDHLFSQKRKIILIAVLFQIILLASGGALAISDWRAYRWLTFLIAPLAILVIALLCGYLYWRFSSLPAIERKRLLETKSREARQLLENIKLIIDNAVRTREVIKQDEQDGFSRRQSEYSLYLQELKQRRDVIISSAKREHTEKLWKLQQKFISAACSGSSSRKQTSRKLDLI